MIDWEAFAKGFVEGILLGFPLSILVGIFLHFVGVF